MLDYKSEQVVDLKARTNHGQRLPAVQHHLDVVDDLPNVVVGNLGAPTRPDALGPVDQDHGDDGDVPFRFDLEVVVGHAS